MDFSRAWIQTLQSKYFRNELQVTSKETKFSKRESKIQGVFSTMKEPLHVEAQILKVPTSLTLFEANSTFAFRYLCAALLMAGEQTAEFGSALHACFVSTTERSQTH